MAAVTADTARLFFAAWPAPDVQCGLGELARALQRECGGRAVPADNIHLTLVFLGDVERAILPSLNALAAAVTAPRFDLQVGRVEFWRHNRIVWAGVEECPEPLPRLVARLGQALAATGVRLDQRPYVPHITLLRDARRAPASNAVAAIRWPVADFVLVESVQRERGRVYEVLQRWPLNQG